MPHRIEHIDSLIGELNALSRNRKDCVDRLWMLESRSEELRVELLNELNML